MDNTTNDVRIYEKEELRDPAIPSISAVLTDLEILREIDIETAVHSVYKAGGCVSAAISLKLGWSLGQVAQQAASGVGGALGTALVMYGIRDEQWKVWISTFLASQCGTLAACVWLTKAYWSYSYSAAVGCSVYHAAGGGGALAFVLANCCSFALSFIAPILMASLVWCIWCFLGETSKTDNPCSKTFYNALCKEVRIRVSANIDQITGSSSRDNLFLVRPSHGDFLEWSLHTSDVLAATKDEPNLEHVDTLGLLLVLQKMQTRLKEQETEKSWYNRWFSTFDIESFIRLLGQVLIIANCKEVEDEDTVALASHDGFSRACDSLSESGKVTFGSPISSFLFAGIDELSQSISGRIREHERKDALAFLGLPETASDNQIKIAYRRLSAEMHPDKVRGRREGNILQTHLNTAKDFLLHRGRSQVFQVLMLDESPWHQSNCGNIDNVEQDNEKVAAAIIKEDQEAALSPVQWLYNVEASSKRFHVLVQKAAAQKEAFQTILRTRERFNNNRADSESDNDSIDGNFQIAPKSQKTACVLADTMFVKADGTHIVVKDLKLEDTLMGSKGDATLLKMELHPSGKVTLIVHLLLGNRGEPQNNILISVTFDHRITLSSGDFAKAEELKPGDFVQTYTMQLAKSFPHPPNMLCVAGASHRSETVEFKLKGPICVPGFQASRWFGGKQIFESFQLEFSDTSPFSVKVPKQFTEIFYPIAKEKIQAAAQGSRIRRVKHLEGAVSTPRPEGLTP